MQARELINRLKHRRNTDFVFIRNNEFGQEERQTFLLLEIPESFFNASVKEFEFWMEEGSPFSKPELILYI